jgi:hypothetical protein
MVCSSGLDTDQIVCDLIRTVSHDRGRGYSNRFTLCRGCALYPHYGAPGLILPFGWTGAAPTKLVYCLALLRSHRQSYPPRVMSWVAPVSPCDTCHRRGQTKLSQTGTWYHITKLGSQDYRHLLGQGSTHA